MTAPMTRERLAELRQKVWFKLTETDELLDACEALLDERESELDVDQVHEVIEAWRVLEATPFTDATKSTAPWSRAYMDFERKMRTLATISPAAQLDLSKCLHCGGFMTHGHSCDPAALGITEPESSAERLERLGFEPPGPDTVTVGDLLGLRRLESEPTALESEPYTLRCSKCSVVCGTQASPGSTFFCSTCSTEPSGEDTELSKVRATSRGLMERMAAMETELVALRVQLEREQRHHSETLTKLDNWRAKCGFTES